MENNIYANLKLMREGTPTGIAWIEFIEVAKAKTIAQLLRASQEDLVGLQHKLRLYEELQQLPSLIKRNTENA